MADEVKDAKPAPAEAAQATKAPAEGGSASGGKKKKTRPTNCAQSNKRIRRKDWYYRDGKYFANKQCHRLYVTQQREKTEAKPAANENA